MYPAAYPWVLGIMASTQGNARAYFSNYDCTPHDSNEYELMAPGVDVWSTLPKEAYAAWSGTSMATPVVSGIAALMRSYLTDKDMYSSRYIMGQIAANASPVADAFAALTVAPQPKLSYLEHWLFDTKDQAEVNDDDGRVDAGETVDLAVVIRNHWGKADNVQVKLEPIAQGAFQPDPYVIMIIPTVDYGAVGSFNQDDNGLIYNELGEITGVQHPFQFSVSTECPNDHVIPFRVIMTCTNGYDSSLPSQTFTGYFEIIVQRGVELQKFIDTDITLTKDKLYIVTNPVLIKSGATLTIESGVSIQFWSSDPDSPYSTQSDAQLVVEGSLIIHGSNEYPVKMFPSQLSSDRFVQIIGSQGCSMDFQYADIMNPRIKLYEGNLLVRKNQSRASHCRFHQSADMLMYWDSTYSNFSSDTVKIEIQEIEKCIFYKLGVHLGVDVSNFKLRISPDQKLESSIFDGCGSYISSNFFSNTVFLTNFKTFNDGSISYSIIKGFTPIINIEYAIDDDSLFQASGSTYWNVNLDGDNIIEGIENYGWYNSLRSYTRIFLAEEYAKMFGGHLVIINNNEEQTVIENNLTGEIILGISDWNHDGALEWVNGDTIDFANWNIEYPFCSTTIDSNSITLAQGKWYQQCYNDIGFFGAPPMSRVLIETPNLLTLEEIKSRSQQYLLSAIGKKVNNNAFLNLWTNPNSDYWLHVTAPQLLSVSSSFYTSLAENYWGTNSTTLIESSIYDFNDNFYLPNINYRPILTIPPEECYPFVVNVILSVNNIPTSTIGVEPVEFTVTFNRDMDISIQPQVSFGPDTPMTDYTVHPVNGGWQAPRTWKGTFNIFPTTGDGYQLIRVAGAVAADDPWLVTGDDAGRFRFEIITSGTEAMNLQATGGEGYIDLMWTQDDYDLLAGFNLYRSTTREGGYIRLNSSIIPPDQRTYRDTNVQPGQPYYYKFTVVQTDLSESDFSNTATATPTDTIPPTLTHTPVTSAAPGLPLTLYADATDNVHVQTVILYYRKIGQTTYAGRGMVNVTGARYSATLEGSLMAYPGVEYYIEAFDGISKTLSGRSDYPWQIVVVDKPVVTAISPTTGPSDGGTAVTVSGTNFKAGAAVRLGGASCSDIVLVSSTQISCKTPAHHPETVDVVVANPDAQTGALLRGFTFTSDSVTISMPSVEGGQHQIVQIPVSLSNVEGLLAANLTIGFDSTILTGRNAAVGSLTPGWSLSVNTDTPGQIQVSMASAGAVSGSGPLVVLEFEVVGDSGESCSLIFSSVNLNDRSIQPETINGQFTVARVYGVSGMVQYWNGSRPVAGTQLGMVGERTFSGTSQSDGAYSVSGLAPGNYTLTPSKADGSTHITAYDASLALQHGSGKISLAGQPALAGDVNKSGEINSMDAAYILQKSVSLITLPFEGAGKVWEFSPQTYAYNNLTGNLTDQNFMATLIGDISGNWNGGEDPVQNIPQAAADPNQTGTIILQLPNTTLKPGQQGTAPLMVQLNGQAFIAANLDIRYDPSVVSALSVSPGNLIPDWAVVANTLSPGLIKIGIAGVNPLGSSGELIQIAFEAKGATGDATDLVLTEVELDEGQISVDGSSGRIVLQDGEMGNVNGDDRVDLTDAMLCLKVMAGFSVDNLHLEADVDGDGKIGMAEVIYILQKVAGL